MKQDNKEISGILPVFKPVGFSSYDIIRIFKKETGFRGKIGHGGALDPFASGLLLILLGKETKRFSEIGEMEKTYLAGIRLGAKSSTGDVEGNITNYSNKKVTVEEIKQTLNNFLGFSKQKIPDFSARKINGQPAYKLARAGKSVPAKYKNIEIKKIDLVSFKYPFLTVRLTVSGGTYIRQISEDIGNQLKCGAFLFFLNRERIGNYSIENAVSIDRLAEYKKFIF